MMAETDIEKKRCKMCLTKNCNFTILPHYFEVSLKQRCLKVA